jgi:hypothetical protein
MSINDIQWVTDAPGKCWGSCRFVTLKVLRGWDLRAV